MGDPLTCSYRHCLYDPSWPHSAWITLPAHTGCDCCLLNNGTMVPDGSSWWDTSVRPPQEKECCRGQVVTLQTTHAPPHSDYGDHILRNCSQGQTLRLQQESSSREEIAPKARLRSTSRQGAAYQYNTAGSPTSPSPGLTRDTPTLRTAPWSAGEFPSSITMTAGPATHTSQEKASGKRASAGNQVLTPGCLRSGN